MQSDGLAWYGTERPACKGGKKPNLLPCVLSEAFDQIRFILHCLYFQLLHYPESKLLHYTESKQIILAGKIHRHVVLGWYQTFSSRLKISEMSQ